MSLSEQDLNLHKEILSNLSEAFLIVLEDPDLIVFHTHRNDKIPWEQVLKINIKRVSELINSFDKYAQDRQKQREFEFHGLTGIELELKHYLIDIPYRRFRQSYESYKIAKGPGKLIAPRRWFFRFLVLLDNYLDSFEKIIPLVGVVKEFKGILEGSIGVSQRKIGEE